MCTTVQTSPDTKFKNINFLIRILYSPATKGMIDLIIPKNLPIIILLSPYFKKKAFPLSR